jgi:hypothetical protein
LAQRDLARVSSRAAEDDSPDGTRLDVVRRYGALVSTQYGARHT